MWWRNKRAKVGEDLSLGEGVWVSFVEGKKKKKKAPENEQGGGRDEGSGGGGLWRTEIVGETFGPPENRSLFIEISSKVRVTTSQLAGLQAANLRS